MYNRIFQFSQILYAAINGGFGAPPSRLELVRTDRRIPFLIRLDINGRLSASAPPHRMREAFVCGVTVAAAALINPNVENGLWMTAYVGVGSYPNR